MTEIDSERLALRLTELVDSKKGEEIVALDMRGLVSYTDFLVICTARNERQAAAIRDEVRFRLKTDAGLLPGRVEGAGSAGWVLLDYLDCVLHVFSPEARARYQLEDLWRDAPWLELGVEAAAPSRAVRA